MQEELDGVDSYEKIKKAKKRKFKNVNEKINDCFEPRKNKMRIDFNNQESASIKSFAVKKKKCHYAIHVGQASHVCKTFP